MKASSIASRIAIKNKGEVKSIRVQMKGSGEVSSFLSKIRDAQKKAHRKPVKIG